MFEKFRKIIFVLVSVAIIGCVFFGGMYLGASQRPEIEKVFGLKNKEELKPSDVDFTPFWTAWNIVNEKYVAKDKIEAQKLVYGAIEGMVSSLGDPYSTFFPPTESKIFNEDVTGSFQGVGMEIAVKDGVLTVVAPLKDTPAYKAGVKAGDKILKIDDKLTNGISSEEAASFIRGPQGTIVTLTIFRQGQEDPIEKKIVRQLINIPTIETEQKEGGVFVIKLYNFYAMSAELFRGALREFIDSGSHKLILDLRNNPGGFLDASVDMSSWFLPLGKPITRESFGGNREENVFRSKGYNIFNENLEMIILVNEGSASASEILAGALQEHKIAKLVGTKTYGKGSVQELLPVTTDTSLKITIAKWLTPNGRSISDEGLDPDYKVEITQKESDALKDPQMDKAISILTNSK